MSKLAMIATGAVGYLAGSRAGREPFERFSARAEKVANDPRVRKVTSRVSSKAKRRADEAAGSESGPEQPMGRSNDGVPSEPTPTGTSPAAAEGETSAVGTTSGRLP